jgi:hypothetical protein
MEEHYRRAIRNVVKLGDTDIFPFPIENHILFDKPDEAVELLKSLDVNVRQSLATRPPFNVGALAPVGYTGFRWASQLDPIWNVAFLAWVLSLAEKIEAARVPVADNRVFSYRYAWSEEHDTCFKRDIGWRQFMETAIAKAGTRAHVVSCDISEFYLRINHHRVENALLQLPDSAYEASRIKAFLSNFSGTYSFGLPIGGPAARLISEIVLNQIDRLLIANQVDFIRFADDYFIFADSTTEGFNGLVILTKLLIQNQGLQLQKSKTRIMTSAEFLSTNPLVHDDREADVVEPLGEARQAVMSINVHFDPYSPTAAEDYAALQTELDRYPIIELIRAELKKSQVNVSLSKRLIGLSRYLNGAILNDTIKTLIENEELLYPVYFNVLITTRAVFQDLDDETKGFVLNVRRLISIKSRVMVVDINLQYAVRLLAAEMSEESKLLFNTIFTSDRNDLIKRDIIIAFTRWHDWYWLSDLKNRYRNLSAPERRAFVIASFHLGDEGQHWRQHMRLEFGWRQKLASLTGSCRCDLRDPFCKFLFVSVAKHRANDGAFCAPL